MRCQNFSLCSFVSSQSTRVSDRRTDGQTDGQTDRQNYDPQDRASIAASRGKNGRLEGGLIRLYIDTL